MWLGPSNQLMQIDTGKARTYLYNKSQSPIQVYSDIGEVQVLGQRFVGYSNATASNPSGSPAIYMLVKYLSTSALVTGDLKAAPAPVYWTDNTFSTVTAITTEAIGAGTGSIYFPAGYLMVNTTDVPGLTGAQVLGAQLLIQVAGYLKSAYAPTTTTGAGIGAPIFGVAGTFTSSTAAAGTAEQAPFGRQLTAIASGLCDVLVTADNF